MAFLAALPELLGAAGEAEAGASVAGAGEGGAASRFASLFPGFGPNLKGEPERSGGHPGLEPQTYKAMTGSEAFFGRGDTQASVLPYRFSEIPPGNNTYRPGRGFQGGIGTGTGGAEAPMGGPSGVPSSPAPSPITRTMGATASAPETSPQLSTPVSASVSMPSAASPAAPAPAVSPILPAASRGAYRPMNGFPQSRSASFQSGVGSTARGS